MKITFFENKFGSSFDITPETIEEVAALARMAANTSAEKAEVSFYFSGSPSASVWLRKVKEKSQKNYISKTRG